ncbi:hypothetical protein Leryth_027249 [Lithospermum erythrorhizon]|nr:hypothetical protein Leryth_027249 [Lithospermum erythrorhizon]
MVSYEHRKTEANENPVPQLSHMKNLQFFFPEKSDLDQRKLRSTQKTGYSRYSNICFYCSEILLYRIMFDYFLRLK